MRRERGDGVDVLGVDEGAGGVDVEPGEAELLGQADVEDRQIALQVGLLVDHQVLEAFLDRLGGVRRHVEAGEQHLAGLQRSRAREHADVGGQGAVVGDDDLDVRVGLDHADEHRGAGVRIGVGRLVDLLIDHLGAGLLDRLDHADRALAAVAALALEAPYERRVAGLQAGALGRLGAERVAGGVVGRADIAHALRAVLRLGVRQRGVRRGEDDALRESLVDQRIGRVVAGMAHEGDAVDLGGDRLLQLGQHQVRIPVGEVIGDRRPEIELGLPIAVVDVVGEDAALRPAGERGDLDARAPFRGRVGGVRRRNPGDHKRERRGRAKNLAYLRFMHENLPTCCGFYPSTAFKFAIAETV